MPHHALIETVVDVHQSADSIANSPNSQQLWARRSMPVLAVGTQEVVAEQERAHFKDHRSRAVTLEGCGHWIHQERPGEFNELLEDWLCALD
ncbi:alpha/beta fold hydrolase [Nocardioides immobilis]|nr:alpha/beta hydrolase [Nocardioides immobilis]